VFKGLLIIELNASYGWFRFVLSLKLKQALLAEEDQLPAYSRARKAQEFR
jgi:hypothetical protein